MLKLQNKDNIKMYGGVNTFYISVDYLFQGLQILQNQKKIQNSINVWKVKITEVFKFLNFEIPVYPKEK